MKKTAETLAKEYDFNTKEDYFNYIVDSLINGQRQQMRNLFNQMNPYDQKEFLVDYLDHDNGYQTSCKNMLISELLN